MQAYEVSNSKKTTPKFQIPKKENTMQASGELNPKRLNDSF